MESNSYSPPHPRWIWIAVIAITAQIIASFFFNIHVSYFIADDLYAIDLSHQTDFLSFIATPIDIHRAPLHRAVNYVLQHTLPMNFAAATAFMLACHALSLLLLHQTMNRLNSAPWFNLIVVMLCALNHTVLEPLHWWSAGLHRFPYVFFATLSCYCFVRFHQERRTVFALGAFFSAVLASGFFAKGVLIPAYWAGLLFCQIKLHRWRDYRSEFLLIGAGFMYAALYAALQPHAEYNAYRTNSIESLFGIVSLGLEWGMSAAAKLGFQLRVYPVPNVWVNSMWTVALAALAWKSPKSRRAIVMGLSLIALNLVVILMSPRATQYGALIMLARYYYYELLFLFALFAALAGKQLVESVSLHIMSLQRQRLTTCAATITCIFYGALGWQTALSEIDPGPNEAHWQSAHYIQNLRKDMTDVDLKSLNLLDRAIPKFFKFDSMMPNVSPQSTMLSWFGWPVQFQQSDRPLSYIDDAGHLRQVHAGSTVTLSANNDGTQPCLSARTQRFDAQTPLQLEQGYFTVDYHTDTDSTIELTLNGEEDKRIDATVSLPASQPRVVVDSTRFIRFVPITLRAVQARTARDGVCLQSISLTNY